MKIKKPPPVMVLAPMGATAMIGAIAMIMVAAAGAAAQESRPQRFDYLVREDLFAGFRGDQARFDKGMKTCEDALKENPKNAPAMAWHAAGLLYASGQSFRTGDPQKGMELWDRALKESDAAADLDPTNPGVIIPRAASMMAAARFAPENLARPLRQRVVVDYERTLESQKPYLENLGVHPRGELLSGLAENYHWMGNSEKSREMLQRIEKELYGTVYQKNATAWLKNPPTDPKASTLTCQGCHTKSAQ